MLNIQRKWLVTGAAGFIGSHLVEFLLKNNQIVVGIDNFVTGFQKNIDLAVSCLSEYQKSNFTFCAEDIRDEKVCIKASHGVDIILHQAALGSVPRSIENPLDTHFSNVTGSLNMLNAAKQCGVKAFVYASSSSVYGDSELLPKQESVTGNLLSPYALSKHCGEQYAAVFARCYGISAVGLRYFNVFGPRQNKDGPYAAVIPLWIDSMLNNTPVYINGDGSTSRDFTYIQNVINANILASWHALNQTYFHDVYNIGLGSNITLLELFDMIAENIQTKTKQPLFKDFRIGDVKHSIASIDKAKRDLGYTPDVNMKEHIKTTIDFFTTSKQEGK